MKEQFISELKVGEAVVSFFLVRRKQLENFRDPSRGQFLTLVLVDRTGQMIGRVWENAREAYDAFAEGEVVKVQGVLEYYRDRPQLIAQRLRRAEPAEYDAGDFVPSTDKDVVALTSALRAAIAEVTHPSLGQLLRSFFDDEAFMQAFQTAPGSKAIHHPHLGGLLEHTLEVLSLAKALMQICPQIDRELLVAGVVLHDVGKTVAYEYTLDIDYSVVGRLEGHVALSDRMLNERIRAIPGFPEELRLRLSHMVLSHHGRYEWGSPREPATLEACALHHLDELSAQVNRFARVVAAASGADAEALWSDYDRVLRRFLYLGRPYDEIVVEEDHAGKDEEREG